MGQYLPVIALTVLGILFGALSFVASRLLAPRRPSSAKEAPYECGIVPTREPPERFPVSFYIVAMLFIMFDIEIISFIPTQSTEQSSVLLRFGKCWLSAWCSFWLLSMWLLAVPSIGVRLPRLVDLSMEFRQHARQHRQFVVSVLKAEPITTRLPEK